MKTSIHLISLILFAAAASCNKYTVQNEDDARQPQPQAHVQTMLLPSDFIMETLPGTSQTITVSRVTFTDGTLTDDRDISGSVRWSSDAPSVADAAAGKLTGVSCGTAQLTASHEDRTVTVTVKVMPETTVNAYTGILFSEAFLKDGQLHVAWISSRPLDHDITVTLGWSADPSKSVDNVTLRKGEACGTIRCFAYADDKLRGLTPDLSFIVGLRAMRKGETIVNYSIHQAR